jgi:anti-anti-sigma factor
MKIETRKEPGACIVCLQGRMDAVSAPEFDRSSEEWLARGESIFILDCSGLDYISSAGLRSLLVLGRKLSPLKGKLLIAAMRDVVKDVIQISGFSSLFPVAESIDAALRQV